VEQRISSLFVMCCCGWMNIICDVCRKPQKVVRVTSRLPCTDLWLADGIEQAKCSLLAKCSQLVPRAVAKICWREAGCVWQQASICKQFKLISTATTELGDKFHWKGFILPICSSQIWDSIGINKYSDERTCSVDHNQLAQSGLL